MGLVNKILGGSSALLLGLCFLFFTLNKSARAKVETLRQEVGLEKIVKEKSLAKSKQDSLNFVNTIRELQSVMQQVNNKNKSLEKENVLLRRGIRLDLLTIKQRRNGKNIDSTYTIGYKYINK